MSTTILCATFVQISRGLESPKRSRLAAASPATGSPQVHCKEEATLIEAAFCGGCTTCGYLYGGGEPAARRTYETLPDAFLVSADSTLTDPRRAA